MSKLIKITVFALLFFIVTALIYIIYLKYSEFNSTPKFPKDEKVKVQEVASPFNELLGKPVDLTGKVISHDMVPTDERAACEGEYYVDSDIGYVWLTWDDSTMEMRKNAYSKLLNQEIEANGTLFRYSGTCDTPEERVCMCFDTLLVSAINPLDQDPATG